MAELHLYLQKKDSLMTAITYLSVFTHLTHESDIKIVIISEYPGFQLIKSYCFRRIDWTVIKMQSVTPHNTLKSRTGPKSLHQHLSNSCLRNDLDTPLDFFCILIYTFSCLITSTKQPTLGTSELVSAASKAAS